MLEVGRIDHRDERVEPREVAQRAPLFVGERERFGHRQWLGNAGRFDQQIIEATFLREATHLDKQVFTQRAADAAVRHLDQLLIDTTQRRPAVSHQPGIDVQFAHVVDDHRDLQALTIIEHMIQQRRLPRTQEARENRYRQPVIAHHLGTPKWRHSDARITFEKESLRSEALVLKDGESR